MTLFLAKIWPNISIQTTIAYCDAIDSVKTKAALIAYWTNKIKIITGRGAGGQTDPGQTQIADLSRTIQDPLLAKKCRSVLRKDFHFTQNPKRKFAVDSVFSTQPIIFPQVGDNCNHFRHHELCCRILVRQQWLPLPWFCGVSGNRKELQK